MYLKEVLMSRLRRNFTKEFKIEAVKLLTDGGCSAWLKMPVIWAFAIPC